MAVNPSLDVFISHLWDSLQRLHSKQRPWPELIDPNAFSRPSSFSQAASRLHRNADYFRINYAELILSLLSHPASLLFLALLCFSWFSLYLFSPPERSFSMLGHSFSRNQLLSLLGVATALVLLFTSVGTLLLHTFLVGLALVSVHAAFNCLESDPTAHHYAAATYSSSTEASFSLTKRSPGLGGDDALASIV